MKTHSLLLFGLLLGTAITTQSRASDLYTLNSDRQIVRITPHPYISTLPPQNDESRYPTYEFSNIPAVEPIKEQSFTPKTKKTGISRKTRKIKKQNTPICITPNAQTQNAQKTELPIGLEDSNSAKNKNTPPNKAEVHTDNTPKNDNTNMTAKPILTPIQPTEKKPEIPLQTPPITNNKISKPTDNDAIDPTKLDMPDIMNKKDLPKTETSIKQPEKIENKTDNNKNQDITSLLGQPPKIEKPKDDDAWDESKNAIPNPPKSEDTSLNALLGNNNAPKKDTPEIKTISEKTKEPNITEIQGNSQHLQDILQNMPKAQEKTKHKSMLIPTQDTPD